MGLQKTRLPGLRFLPLLWVAHRWADLIAEDTTLGLPGKDWPESFLPAGLLSYVDHCRRTIAVASPSKLHA